MVVNNREAGEKLIPRQDQKHEFEEKKRSVQRTKEEMGGRKGKI